MQATGDKMGFPLEAEELAVTLNVRGQKVVHVFAPVSAADWLQYERLAVLTSRRDGDRVVEESMRPEAVEWLWGERIRRVWAEDFDQVINFAMVPSPHKQAAIDALAKVDAEPDPESRWFLGGQAVLVRALRNGKVYQGLRHSFRMPSAADHAEYSRAKSRSVSVEVGKDQRMVACSTLQEKVDLYDKLIERVEGYDPNDPKKVDALHKKVAITALMELALGNVQAPSIEAALQEAAGSSQSDSTLS